MTAITLRLSKLGPTRLDVDTRCDHTAVSKYYSILLADIRRRWPRVPEPHPTAEVQVAGTKRKLKMSAQARREKRAEEERKGQIVKRANQIRATEHLAWKEIIIRVGMNSVKTLRDWRRKYG